MNKNKEKQFFFYISSQKKSLKFAILQKYC